MQSLKTARTLELNEKDLNRIAGGMNIDLRPRPIYPTTVTVSSGSSGNNSASSGGSTGDPMNQLETGPK